MTNEKQKEQENMNFDLLAKYLSGECTEDEKLKVEDLITNNSKYQRLLEVMKSVWQTKEPDYKSSNIGEIWSKIASRAGIREESEVVSFDPVKKAIFKGFRFPFRLEPVYYRAFAYAAIILFVVSLPFLFKDIREGLQWSDGRLEMKILQVPRMEQSKIYLSDGTLITLDAESTLRYPEEFTGITREVFLEGEGFFEVASNKSKPFIVHANHAMVEVLGTKFNVKAWKSNKRVDIVVSEGRVAFGGENNNTGQIVQVSKNEFSTLKEGGTATEAVQINVGNYSGWMKFELNYDNKQLSEIMEQLERWYDLSFDYSDPTILDEHVTIHITKRSVDEVLEIIGTISETIVTRNGKNVSIRANDSDK